MPSKKDQNSTEDKPNPNPKEPANQAETEANVAPELNPAEEQAAPAQPEAPGKPQLFFATGNEKKLEEIDAILGKKFDIKSFKDLDAKLDVEETEDTLEGNALLKARAYFAKAGIPTFADDTGLEVSALNGAPGVHSARYAGADGDAEKNMEKLMAELKSATDRSARFRTVIAFVDEKGEKTFEGDLKGEISIVKAGSNGFGYDPLFLPQGQDDTLAELSPEEKNKISHRAKALNKFVAFINK